MADVDDFQTEIPNTRLRSLPPSSALYDLEMARAVSLSITSLKHVHSPCLIKYNMSLVLPVCDAKHEIERRATAILSFAFQQDDREEALRPVQQVYKMLDSPHDTSLWLLARK